MQTKLAEREGVIECNSRNANEDRSFSLKPHDARDLAFASFCLGFRPRAGACGLCQRNDTRNDTRCEALRGRSPQRIFRGLGWTRSANGSSTRHERLTGRYYSCRKAIIGSTRAARRAGTTHASAATATRITETATTVVM